MSGLTDAEREAFIDALVADWEANAAARTVDSPRGHCERLLAAVEPLVAARVAAAEQRSAGRELDWAYDLLDTVDATENGLGAAQRAIVDRRTALARPTDEATP